MPIPILQLQPPPKYGDVSELETVFATIIPAFMPQLAEMFGKRSPHLTRKDRKLLKDKMYKFLRNTRPYLLGLIALRPGPEQRKAIYALYEGLVKEHFRGFGERKIADDQDAFEMMVRHTERVARSPKRLEKFPAYLDTKKATYELILSVCQRVSSAEIERRLQEWWASKSSKKSIHSRVLWPTLLREWRQVKPTRLTFKLVAQLADEYRTGASLLEERLRLLLWLYEISQGTAPSWADQEKRNLFKLLEAAKATSQLSWLPPVIDRHVRNALAHGQPHVNLDADECRFHDTNQSVVWKTGEFFERTKQLTLATRALMEVEAILQVVQAQMLVANLWREAQI